MKFCGIFSNYEKEKKRKPHQMYNKGHSWLKKKSNEKRAGNEKFCKRKSNDNNEMENAVIGKSII